MKQYTLIFTVIFFTIQLLNAQNSAFAPPSIPTSPQAEAFKKYGEYSINYQTGIPDISIPLYEINHYGYKLPIALNYNPIPLKPGYNYDVYGRGWCLSLRSCISRSIEYAPDEWSDFEIENVYKEEFLFNIADNCPNFSCFKDRNFGHDKFNAILPDGSSFDFIIEKINGIMVFRLSNKRKLKIECIAGGINIFSFTIIDENGIKYSFEESDHLNVSGYLSNVAWYLTRIDLPFTNQPIEFSYNLTIQNNFQYNEPNIKLAYTQYNRTQNLPIYLQISLPRIVNIEPIGINTGYRTKLLTMIKYGNDRLQFNHKEQDSYSEYNPLSYSHIENIVLTENEKFISMINFDISSSPFLSNLTSSLQLGTLNSILINGNTSSPKKFDLTYLSNSFSFNGTDHWGNLNWQSYNYGKVGNFTAYVQSGLFQGVSDYPLYIKLLATENSTENPTPFTKIKLQNSYNLTEDERKPMGPEAHGVLKTLRYPTGGYTEFEFENHEFLTANDLNGDYITDPANRIKSKASGFRIKSISNFTSDGLIAETKHYRYGSKCLNPSYPNSIEHSGIGEAVVDPNILTYSYYSSYDNYTNSPINIKKMLLGVNHQYDLHTEQYWECSFNSLNFRKLVGGRVPVIYPEVTVYYGECLDGNYLILPEKTKGKTIYKYELSGYDENNDQTSFFEPIRTLGYTNFYDAKKNRYNRLNEQLDYCWDVNKFKILKKDLFEWEHKSVLFDERIFTYPMPIELISRLKPNAIFQICSVAQCFELKFSYLLSTSILRNKSTILYSTVGDSIFSNSIYDYNTNERLKSINKDDQTTKLKYPDDYSSPVFQKMVEKNMIAPIISSVVDYKGKTQAGNKTVFKEFQFGDQTLILPAEGHKLEFKSTGNEYRLENQILKYTRNGNPLELITKDGIHTCYIWSYDDRYMVANIVGASYNTTGDIVSGTTTLTKSKIDAIVNSTTTESNYLQKLSEIRSILISAEVSTYTYKPLIGISTMTDPRGVTTYYEYDEFNRLKQTYIIEGGVKKILQDLQYNYKN